MIQGESKTSYLYRVAQSNLTTFYSLAREINPQKGCKNIESFISQSAKQITEFFNFTPSTAPEMMEIKGLENHLLSRDVVKYCPKCIDETLYIKQVWEYAPIYCCLEHNCLLIDTCQNCEKVIPVNSFFEDCCSDCGFQFSQSITQPIALENPVYKFQKLLQNKIIGIDCSHYDGFYLERLTVEEIMSLCDRSFYLLNGLNSFIHENETKICCFQNTKVRGKGNFHSAVRYGNIYWMYLDFPIHFYQVLDEFSSVHSRVMKYLRGQHEKLYEDKVFIEIKLLYHNYWKSKSRNFKKLKPKMSKKKRKTIRKKGKARPACAVKNNLIISEKMKDGIEYVTRNEAADMLGISAKVQMNLLIEAGYFTLRKFSYNLWLIEKREVTNFIQQFYDRSSCQVSIQPQISFYEVLKKYSKMGLSMLILIQLILDNKLIPSKRKSFGKISDLFFGDEELKRCLDLLKEQSIQQRGYRMNDVRKLLKMTFNSIKRLEDHKILVPKENFYMNDGRKPCLYDKSEVDRFIADYCTIKQAADEYHLPDKTIREWTNTGKLADYFQGGSRKYLIKRDELTTIINNFQNDS